MAWSGLWKIRDFSGRVFRFVFFVFWVWDGVGGGVGEEGGGGEVGEKGVNLVFLFIVGF